MSHADVMARLADDREAIGVMATVVVVVMAFDIFAKGLLLARGVKGAFFKESAHELSRNRRQVHLTLPSS